MAEEKKEKKVEEKSEKQKIRESREKEKKKEKPVEKGEKITSIVRILSTDVPGNKHLLYGLTRIKGVSFSFARAVCLSLNLDGKRLASSLTPEEIKNITDFILNPKLPTFLLNRRKDFETGQDKHLVTTSLELQRDFDIKRMKQIRCYKGWRHALGQPVRGQRTKSHFRKGSALGVVKTKQKPGTEEKEKKK